MRAREDARRSPAHQTHRRKEETHIMIDDESDNGPSDAEIEEMEIEKQIEAAAEEDA